MQVVTPSLLHVEIVFARRHYRERHLGRVPLASAKCTVRVASGGRQRPAAGAGGTGRWPIRGLERVLQGGTSWARFPRPSGVGGTGRSISHLSPRRTASYPAP